MPLNLPVPEGGTAGHLVKIASGGHALDDGPFTLVATGATGDVTVAKYTTAATDKPSAATPYWLKIGEDSDGAPLFVACYKGTAS
jgi:hypothetical protein